MTITEERPRAPEREFSGDGGVSARRAVARWAWRLLRREWRGQVLVLALLTLAVAAAVGGAAAAYNLAPAAGDAEFGSANHALELAEPDPRRMQIDVPAAEAWFGEVDVIGRQYAPLPGLFDQVELRAQDPTGPYGAPMLALIEGRYPTGAGDVAVTDVVAETLGIGVGDTFALLGTARNVVGTVENPSDLLDEFALVSPAHVGPPDSVTMLVGGTDDQLQTFRPPSGASVTAVARSGNEGALAAVGALVAATVVLMLVALVAAAGFVVMAHRRLRQLGMLAAVGATEQHLRLVMVANGAFIGTMAAVIGSAVGLVAWIAAVPALEPVIGHRIEALNVPWWVISAAMLLAIAAATGAAWWPSRAVAHTPIVSALSGRPPPPRRSKRSATLAGVLIVLGTGALIVAGDPTETWSGAVLILAGTVTLIVGFLLISPFALRSLVWLRTRVSIAARLALGDLVRFQARSGTALAAITLTLGIASAVVVVASGAVYASADEGNLSDRQLMIRTDEILDAAELDDLDAAVDRIVASLGDATVVPIDVALALEVDEWHRVVLAEEVDAGGDGDGSMHRILSQLYVATPALLDPYGIDLAEVSPATEVLTVETGELWYQPMSPEVVRNVQRLAPGYSSLPGSFITPDALRDRGWEIGRTAWLVEASAPITDEQFAEIRELVAGTGATIEMRHDQANLATLRTGATAVGGLLSLGIMAMTVGLIRSEAARDLRILTATGATSGNRRTLTATTGGALALLGALLGTVGAYLGLGAARLNDLDSLTPVPVLHLAVIVAGLPLVAAGAGWLLAGREPPWIARQPLE